MWHGAPSPCLQIQVTVVQTGHPVLTVWLWASALTSHVAIFSSAKWEK